MIGRAGTDQQPVHMDTVTPVKGRVVALAQEAGGGRRSGQDVMGVVGLYFTTFL